VRNFTFDAGRIKLSEVPSTWLEPNYNLYNSHGGYMKICASWVFNITKSNTTDPFRVGRPISDWDRCGLYGIYTKQMDKKDDAERIYWRWPSKQFPDWLHFIEYWGMPNMAGFGFVIVDDIMTTEAKLLGPTDCWKG
jgi:hypothetical protein